MNIGAALTGVQRLYIETAPLIYFGELSSNGSAEKKTSNGITPEDLKLICYEYIYA